MTKEEQKLLDDMKVKVDAVLRLFDFMTDDGQAEALSVLSMATGHAAIQLTLNRDDPNHPKLPLHSLAGVLNAVRGQIARASVAAYHDIEGLEVTLGIVGSREPKMSDEAQVEEIRKTMEEAVKTLKKKGIEVSMVRASDISDDEEG